MKPLVIAIIPARGGSKGLRHKNALKINGEPLIARTIRHAQESNCIDDIIVTTDDSIIANIAEKAGAKVPFIRPLEFSGDCLQKLVFPLQ